jgi:acetamidase/formamidase
MPTHHFTPERYHVTIGNHLTALSIADGDTVITTTVDAAGYDQRGEHVTEGGNPMTGPFFVEGAEPGDTLAVRLDRILPNRDYGFASTVVAENVVDPAYVRELPERVSGRWSVDPDGWTTTLEAPETALGRLTLPIAPMIGCFGVAPARGEAISTATSGPHGGNMDYRGHVEGVTVYFPVFVPGALLHIGDGHAVQGCGEIVGTGVEISLDVQFTVNVLKGVRSQWPRSETEEELIALGNARPLDQALQHATTELMRWLEDDYGLDKRAASILLGQTIRYEIGNVYDPAYTVAAKVEKRWLSRVR